MTDLANLTHRDFERCVGERFEIELAGGVGDADAAQPFALELVEVEVRSGRDPNGNARQPFSLIFHAALEPVLPQQVYALSNERLGATPLFLVPIGPSKDRMRYEAVFN